MTGESTPSANAITVITTPAPTAVQDVTGLLMRV